MTSAARIYPDAASFLAVAQEALEVREDENGFVLGLALRAAQQPRPGDEQMLLATVTEGGAVVGAAASPPGGLLAHTELSPGGVDTLVDVLAAEGVTLPHTVAPRPSAELFAERWAQRNGLGARVAMEKRLYRLDAVEHAPAVEGRFRPAREADVPLLREWYAGFARDTKAPTSQDRYDAAAVHVEQGTLFLWDVGRPVAMAARTRPTRRGCGVSAVYTPDAERGHGYGSAVTAALSRHLQASGSEYCVLFTDLANPTSNRIYARIGYRPVRDFRLFAFDG